MWKKVLLSITGLLVVTALVAVIATAVRADDGNPGIRGPRGGQVMDRAAQILGIDKQKLVDAFKQAGKETAKQNMEDRFAGWVSDGKLTQSQAEQYQGWLAARPAGLPPIACFDTERSGQALDRLLENGKITQAQYDAFKSWLAQKPSFDLPQPQRPADMPLRKHFQR